MLYSLVLINVIQLESIFTTENSQNLWNFRDIWVLIWFVNFDTRLMYHLLSGLKILVHMELVFSFSLKKGWNSPLEIVDLLRYDWFREIKIDFCTCPFRLCTSFKELENAVDGWTDDLAHLSLLKESLSTYISADDISVLSERIELLHRQWEELCHQASIILSFDMNRQTKKVLEKQMNASGIF